MKWLGALAFFSFAVAHATPYFDADSVPKDSAYPRPAKVKAQRAQPLKEDRGLPVLRVSVRLDGDARFAFTRAVREFSGTPALFARAGKVSALGSYRAVLRDARTGDILARDTIGTGRQYRRLVDEITFRFPFPAGEVLFEMEAEHPQTGALESAVTRALTPAEIPTMDTPTVKTRELKAATLTPSVRVNIYAEGYLAARENEFWKDAERAVGALVKNKFPGVERMRFTAVFAPSREKLGDAADLGIPRRGRDTFLGLYFPYWNQFGRWYNVVYPSRENEFRTALASAPYDYPLVLTDDAGYWGIGNFRVVTTVPARNDAFTYLLLHELGHFFGLNEEYQEGGPTELEFAPGIAEPWSQNITFLRIPDYAHLKWNKFVSPSTPLPTPASLWSSARPVYGAYPGGYAESEPRGHSHKPGLSCVMESSQNFCDVCREAIEEVVRFDAGATSEIVELKAYRPIPQPPDMLNASPVMVEAESEAR